MGYWEEDHRGEVPFITRQPLALTGRVNLDHVVQVVFAGFPHSFPCSLICGGVGGGERKEEEIKLHLLDGEVFAYVVWIFFYNEFLFLFPCQSPL